MDPTVFGNLCQHTLWHMCLPVYPSFQKSCMHRVLIPKHANAPQNQNSQEIQNYTAILSLCLITVLSLEHHAQKYEIPAMWYNPSMLCASQAPTDSAL